MNIFHDIDPALITADSFTAVIEITKGSKVKYELDKDTGMLRVDRILHTATRYPVNYGFLPLTYADDGDPLDALVVCSEDILPMSLVQCRPVGVIRMIDGGEADEKIIAVVEKDPIYKDVKDLEDLPKHLIDEMCHFFTVYKALENKTTEVSGAQPKAEAKKIIDECIAGYKKKFKS